MLTRETGADAARPVLTLLNPVEVEVDRLATLLSVVLSPVLKLLTPVLKDDTPVLTLVSPVERDC